jgi:hypothetical protein
MATLKKAGTLLKGCNKKAEICHILHALSLGQKKITIVQPHAKER